jgi:hypothetical protein
LRTVALLSWLLVGGVFAFEWTRRALPRPGARMAGRQVAVALVATSVLVLVLAGSFLGDATVELGLAGSTPWSFALELSLGGVVMAVLVLLATELWERRVRPIASAPESGSFALKTHSRSTASSLSLPRPAVTGDTHVGPAVTGNTQVGPPPAPPAVTGDTQVGPPPAITGNTKVGPPPRPIPLPDGGPPVREIISGDIEVQTQVRRAPEPDTVKTTAPLPPAHHAAEADEDTNPRGTPGHDGPASLADPRDLPRGAASRRAPPPPRATPERRPAPAEAEPAHESASLPKLEIDWS